MSFTIFTVKILKKSCAEELKMVMLCSRLYLMDIVL